MHVFRCIYINLLKTITCLHDSIVVSIPACHAGDRGSIPRRGAFLSLVNPKVMPSAVSIEYKYLLNRSLIKYFPICT